MLESANILEHAHIPAPLMDAHNRTVPAHPWPPAPLAPGVDAKAPRMANKVYSNIVSGMLTEAEHKFECLLFIENAYPDVGTQVNWSIKIWEEICIKSGNYYNLVKDMMNLVRILSLISVMLRMFNTDELVPLQIKARCSHG